MEIIQFPQLLYTHARRDKIRDVFSPIVVGMQGVQRKVILRPRGPVPPRLAQGQDIARVISRTSGNPPAYYKAIDFKSALYGFSSTWKLPGDILPQRL